MKIASVYEMKRWKACTGMQSLYLFDLLTNFVVVSFELKESSKIRVLVKFVRSINWGHLREFKEEECGAFH